MWFWISKLFPSRPRTAARGTVRYARTDGVASAARPSSARSKAEVLSPGASRPDGSPAWVSNAPSARARAFIRVTAGPWPPAASARAVAASLPLAISIAVASSATE